MWGPALDAWISTTQNYPHCPKHWRSTEFKCLMGKGDIVAVGLSEKREADLDLCRCHMNQFCQLHKFLLVWVLGLIKMFLQQALLFFRVHSAFFSNLSWSHRARLIVAISTWQCHRSYGNMETRSHWGLECMWWFGCPESILRVGKPGPITGPGCIQIPDFLDGAWDSCWSRSLSLIMPTHHMF